MEKQQTLVRAEASGLNLTATAAPDWPGVAEASGLDLAAAAAQVIGSSADPAPEVAPSVAPLPAQSAATDRGRE